jgi:hypothetical protein
MWLKILVIGFIAFLSYFGNAEVREITAAAVIGWLILVDLGRLAPPEEKKDGRVPDNTRGD